MTPGALPPRIGRTPPAGLMVRLKEVCPTVELLNVDGGIAWWEMDFVPVESRMAHAAEQYQREYDRLKDGQEYRRVVLQLFDWGRAGWVCIGKYHAAPDGSLPEDRMVHELRLKQAATPDQLEQAYDATERATGKEAAQATAKANWEDYISAEGRSIFKHARGNPHFVMQGLRKD